MPSSSKIRSLHVAAVDPDAARAELPAVQHQVVGLGTDGEEDLVGTGRGVEQPDVVGVGHGERMVSRHGPSVVGDGLEQRELDDPQEVEAALVDGRATELEAQQPEHVVG